MNVNFCSFYVSAAVLLLFLVLKTVSSLSSACGKLDSKNHSIWTVGIYLEKEKDHLELVCLGTIFKSNRILTASQCVCETLSNDLRKEKIYVSKEIQERLEKGSSNAIEVKPENVEKPKEYQGFLLNPIGDLVVLKTEHSLKESSNPICVDWSDLTNLLKKDKVGVSSIWNSRLETVESSILDYDLCESLSSEGFSGLLSADKDCFKISGTNVQPQTVGSGIYYQNPKNGQWYVVGVVSNAETVKESAFLAATSVRKYLSWLSRIS